MTPPPPVPAPAHPGLSLVSDDLVTQVTEPGQSVQLRKTVHRLDGELPLSLVRKQLPGGATRPPVLLVHGFAQNRYSWHTAQLSLTAWLAQRGWDTWNLELRGHGRSRAAGLSGAEVFSDYVLDVQLAAAALPQRAFWIGHSLGGAALFAAAAELWTASQAGVAVADRDELSAGHALPLGVLGIGALYSFGQANGFLKLLGRLTHGFRDAPWMSALQIRTRLAGTLLARLYGLSDVAGYALPVSGWWPGSMDPAVLQERLDRGFDWTSVKVWQEMARWAATNEFEWDDAWTRTDLPLLIVAGDKDHLMPPADAKVAYDRSGSRDKTWQLFDDWHHQVHWGHLDLVLGKLAPAEVWPVLHSWMADRSGRRA